MAKYEDLDQHSEDIIDAVEEKLAPLRTRISTLEDSLARWDKAIAEAIIDLDRMINQRGGPEN